MKIYAAPVQGHTDAAWRHFQTEVYGVPQAFVTPFIRLEHGEIRRKDLADILSPLNEGMDLRAQVIFRDEQELSALVNILAGKGIQKIDINMCCPFPLQTARGRGCATVGRPEATDAVRKVVGGHPDIDFSVKIRLGMTDPEEWKSLLPVLNDLPLSRLVVHPRVAKEQYGGKVHLDQFETILSESKIPVVYNGDITTPEQFRKIADRFPDIDGIMLGRGLLGRPSLAREVMDGEEWDHEKRLAMVLDFHRRLLNHYSSALEGGDHQVLSKIAPFWEYAECEIGRKAWKSIKKASNMARYHSAVALIKDFGTR